MKHLGPRIGIMSSFGGGRRSVILNISPADPLTLSVNGVSSPPFPFNNEAYHVSSIPQGSQTPDPVIIQCPFTQMVQWMYQMGNDPEPLTLRECPCVLPDNMTQVILNDGELTVQPIPFSVVFYICSISEPTFFSFRINIITGSELVYVLYKRTFSTIRRPQCHVIVMWLHVD